MDENIQSYAGFWRRFAAYLIDQFIIAWVLNEFWGNYFNNARVYFRLYEESFTGDIYRDMETFATIGMWVLLIPFISMYYAGMESSPLRATVGKLAVGIYVTDLQGQRVSFGRAAGRFFGKILSGMLLGIGYLMAAFTERKQALHDSMSECLVLRK